MRAGSTATGMLNITVLNNGKAMRYVPVAAGSAMQVPLAIVDELRPGTEISVVAAAEAPGTLILDIGILKVNTSYYSRAALDGDARPLRDVTGHLERGPRLAPHLELPIRPGRFV